MFGEFNLASPIFWGSIILLVVGVAVLRRKTNGGIIIGGIFIIGGVYGLLATFGLLVGFSAQADLFTVIAYMVIFVCSILLVITEGWLTKIIGLVIGIAVYFELERITPPDTIFGAIFKLIRQGVETLYNAIAELVT